MSNNISESNLTTDTIPLPPRIHKENPHVDNRWNPNNNTNNNYNRFFRQYPKSGQTSEPKAKKKGTTNYNIVNSKGVNITSSINYTLNLNKNDNQTPNTNKDIKLMSLNVVKLCECRDEITVHDMLLVKMHLGSGWRDVARGIGFSDGQIYQFEEKYKEDKNDGIGEVIYQLLLDWKQANTSEASVGKLASVMWYCQEYDCVKRLANARKIV